MKSKITYLLLSLVIAFALWFYVITVVSPESEEIRKERCDAIRRKIRKENGSKASRKRKRKKCTDIFVRVA